MAQAMKKETMQEELDRLRGENAALQAKMEGGLYLKVSQKGGISMYGLQRFPVTLYKEQWVSLLGMASEVTDFIESHKSELTVKS